MKKLRAALISAGMIANAAHIPAYQNLSDEVEIVGICDLNEQAAVETAKRFGIPNTFTNATEMLDSLKPDIVSISSPPLTHVPLVRLALEKGANVICEKPLALCYKDVLEVFDLAEKKGLLLVPCQSVRYRDDFLAAKDIVSDGTLGNIYFAELSRIRRRGVPKWGGVSQKIGKRRRRFQRYRRTPDRLHIVDHGQSQVPGHYRKDVLVYCAKR